MVNILMSLVLITLLINFFERFQRFARAMLKLNFF